MRILHTSDWHLCKPLYRRDRRPEYEAVLDEVVAIADEQDADLVVHSGDLFDRSLPGPDVVGLALRTLVRLTDGGTRPVVVVAGNHDNPRLFEALAPVLRPLGVHLVGELRSPDGGRRLRIDTPGGPAVVGAIPWVMPAKAVDFMDDPGRAYGTLADTMGSIVGRLAPRPGDPVTILLAHFMVGGVKVRTGEPRGEKELHLGEAFAATPAAVNREFSYVALGHIHAPQAVPGAPVGEYAGSLLQLDFGERGEEKRVVVVEAEPGRPATTTSVPLGAGRRLLRATGTIEELSSRDDLADAWLDLTIRADGPPTADDVARWQSRFPHAVRLTPDYPQADDEPTHVVAGRPLGELYAEYHRRKHGEPDHELLDLFSEIETEARA